MHMYIHVCEHQYRRLGLISACAYHPRWQGNMRLLKSVRLLRSSNALPRTAESALLLRMCQGGSFLGVAPRARYLQLQNLAQGKIRTRNRT